MTVSIRIAAPTFVLLALAGTRAHAADPTSCKLPAGASMSVVRYVDSGKKSSALCDKGGACKLSGWLYKPKGSGPFPTIVLSHDAEQPRAENTYCEITEYFVEHGYLVFQPVRRGYRGDAGVGQNTGKLPGATVADQESQVLDLRAAIDALRQVPSKATHWADTSRIAVMGHGDGASITAMLAGLGKIDGVRAGVLLSPAERSWEPKISDALVTAVEHRGIPLAFLQPRDAKSIAPTETLADAAVGSHGQQLMAALFPAVGGGATPAQIQGRFATGKAHVDRWAPLAFEFLRTHGVGEPRTDPQNTETNNASDTTCDRLEPGTKVTVERFYDPAQQSLEDPLCSLVKGKPTCNLKGILYVPPNAKKHAPAVVLNHGGGEPVRHERGFCAMTEYFNRHGFVVFVPRRRGIGERDGDAGHFEFTSTGVAAGELVALTRDALAAQTALPIGAVRYQAVCKLGTGNRKKSLDCLGGELVRAEAVEVGLAVDWLKARPGLVDAKAVTAIGHSNGGQVVIHAAANLQGTALPDTVIAISPHEKGWNEDGHRLELLEQSVKDAKVPVAIFRPANADNLESTRVLGKLAAATRKRFLTEVFPPMNIPKGETNAGDYVHNAFVQVPNSVRDWGAVARRFMTSF